MNKDEKIVLIVVVLLGILVFIGLTIMFISIDKDTEVQCKEINMSSTKLGPLSNTVCYEVVDNKIQYYLPSKEINGKRYAVKR